MDKNIQILEDKIKFLSNATCIERLSKGYSPDEKYVVVDKYEKNIYYESEI